MNILATGVDFTGTLELILTLAKKLGGLDLINMDTDWITQMYQLMRHLVALVLEWFK